jgi:peptide-methionine (S)-S-oxide reductase
MFFARKKAEMPGPADALPGRPHPIATAQTHFVNGRPLKGPYPEGIETALFGLGCFWGAERKFWQMGEGIWVTAVGYAGGHTPNPTYEEACSGLTGHNEVVLVAFDPARLPYRALLQTFWESHDPTQGMRQGNDVGTQYRSVIYANSAEQMVVAKQVMLEMANVWDAPIVTELIDAPVFYAAEAYHQNYFVNHPLKSYCALVVAPKVTKFRKLFAEKLRK